MMTMPVQNKLYSANFLNQKFLFWIQTIQYNETFNQHHMDVKVLANAFRMLTMIFGLEMYFPQRRVR